ncbi:hypothetical protein GCM10028810_61440 [Spirosoma litoris]
MGTLQLTFVSSSTQEMIYPDGAHSNHTLIAFIMKKLLVCQTATTLFGVLAVVVYVRPELIVENLHNHKLIAEAFGLLSAIFATQWIEYQKRLDKHSVREHLPKLDISTVV